MTDALPRSRDAIRTLQSTLKRRAVERARRTPFWRERLAGIHVDRLDDSAEWGKIPILDKDLLRGLTDEAFYTGFCHSADGIPASVDGAADPLAEYWRSGGSTGKPLFYPRSRVDIEYAMLGFQRVYQCGRVGGTATTGERAHVSFPLGIHPVGQMMARAAQAEGIAVNWGGAGTGTPTAVQLDLIARLKPTIWSGMSSYGLHLANLADQMGIDLAAGSVRTVMCSAEPISDAKRAKLERGWGARVVDGFGMTEAGMMGAEDGLPGGFRMWTDLFHIEVVDPATHQPVPPGTEGALVVTALSTNHITPFLRWLSGDLVVYSEADDQSGPFAVFPKIRHAHRTSGFFKVRGVNLNHSELEDFLFQMRAVVDFKCEAIATDGLDSLRLSIEVARGADPMATTRALVQGVKQTFEVTPDVVVLEPGTLAREFESSVKAPRFADRRNEG